jgi:hypothetical protein
MLDYRKETESLKIPDSSFPVMNSGAIGYYYNFEEQGWFSVEWPNGVYNIVQLENWKTENGYRSFPPCDWYANSSQK